jgi:osmotically-inducible protein OsmY
MMELDNRTTGIPDGRLRALLAAAVLGAALAATLQGCVPVVATGVAVGAMATLDRRSYGTQLEDQEIMVRAQRRIGDKLGERAYVYVTSYNRIVLLTGDAADERIKSEAEQIVRGVRNVREVANELKIGPITSGPVHANDTFITTKVKARFVEAKKFSPNLVKVVTEAGVVYLMGMVTSSEADAATDVARRTDGVKKVVRVFELVSDEEARRMDARRSQEPPADNGKK